MGFWIVCDCVHFALLWRTRYTVEYKVDGLQLAETQINYVLQLSYFNIFNSYIQNKFSLCSSVNPQFLF